jgi:serine/threonine protein kinase
MYKHGDALGAGIFGHVSVVKTSDGVYLAEKVTTNPVFVELAVMLYIRPAGSLPAISYESLDIREDGVIETSFTMPIAPMTLMDWIKANLMKPVDTKLRMFAKIASALRNLHVEHIAHLDLKASNIVIINDEPRLIDFGISITTLSRSRCYWEKISETHRGSQENTSSIYGFDSDIWSLGIILYQMLVNGPLTAPYHNVFDESRRISKYMNDVEKLQVPGLTDLIGSLLKIEREDRVTSQELCENPMLRDYVDPPGPRYQPYEIAFNVEKCSQFNKTINRAVIYLKIKEYNASVVFIGLDLFYRYVTLEENVTSDALYPCFSIAANMTGGDMYGVDSHFDNLSDYDIAVQCYKITKVLKYNLLNCRLYYECQSLEGAKMGFDIIRNVKRYEEYIRNHEHIVNGPTTKNEEYSISELS